MSGLTLLCLPIPAMLRNPFGGVWARAKGEGQRAKGKGQTSVTVLGVAAPPQFPLAKLIYYAYYQLDLHKPKSKPWLTSSLNLIRDNFENLCTPRPRPLKTQRLRALTSALFRFNLFKKETCVDLTLIGKDKFLITHL